MVKILDKAIKILTYNLVSFEEGIAVVATYERTSLGQTDGVCSFRLFTLRGYYPNKRVNIYVRPLPQSTQKSHPEYIGWLFWLYQVGLVRFAHKKNYMNHQKRNQWGMAKEI